MGSKLQNMIILSYRWSMAFQIQVGHQIHWMTLVLLKSREHSKVIHWILFVDSVVFLWAFFGYVCISHTCSEGSRLQQSGWICIKLRCFGAQRGHNSWRGEGGLVVGCGGWGAFNRAIHSQVYIYLTRGRLDHIFDGSQQISFEQPKPFSGSFCILAIFHGPGAQFLCNGNMTLAPRRHM